MPKMGASLPLRRQASDTNLASADYSGRAKVASAPVGAGKRSKSPFAIFRRPKTQDQSPIRAGDMQGRDTMPMHITVRTHYTRSILATAFQSWGVGVLTRDERECLFQSHSLPFRMVHSHFRSKVWPSFIPIPFPFPLIIPISSRSHSHSG